MTSQCPSADITPPPKPNISPCVPCVPSMRAEEADADTSADSLLEADLDAAATASVEEVEADVALCFDAWAVDSPAAASATLMAMEEESDRKAEATDAEAAGEESFCNCLKSLLVLSRVYT